MGGGHCLHLGMVAASSSWHIATTGVVWFAITAGQQLAVRTTKQECVVATSDTTLTIVDANYDARVEEDEEEIYVRIAA